MIFSGSAEQLNNALREIERRGGQVGAVAGAAADEIESLRRMKKPDAGEGDST
jgi:hypothetical protein